MVRELIQAFKGLEFTADDYFIKPSTRGQKVQQLFHILLTDPELDNEGLVKALYDNEEKSQKAFMMLRKSLFSRLLRYVLVVDPAKIYSSRHHHEHINTIRDSIISRSLMFMGLYKSGLFLAKKTVHKAQELEIWDVVYTLSSILSNFYALRDERKSYLEFDELADTALVRATNERKLRKLINKWTIWFGKRKKASSNDIRRLKEDVEQGDEIIQRYGKSPNMLHFNFRLKLIYYDATMDYVKAIEVCDDAIKRLQTGTKFLDQNKLGIYHGTQMYCYLNLKRFEEAKKFAEKNYFIKGTLNWFLNQEYYFVLSIQTANYKNAFELLSQVRGAPGYKHLRGVRKEVWTLLEGYMQFVLLSGIWKTPPETIELRKFRIGRFLNEVFSLSTDKMGVQISVLILQVLFLIQKGEYAQVIDQKDALRRYMYRYLYSKENERSRIFLTMLLRMVECDFSYSETENRTKRLLSSLKSQQMNYQANLGGNEIVDYELLWDWILNHIKKNWSKTVA